MIRNYSLTPFERVSLAIEKPQDPCGKLRTVIFAVAAIVGRDLAEKAARSNQYVGVHYTGQTNLFRNGLEQALHVLQLWPSFIQPVSSQRRQTGSLRGGGVAVLTATCLLVSSLSRFPIAVVSSIIDPFIVFPSVVLFVKWAARICLRRGYPTAPDSIAGLDARTAEHDHFVGALQISR